MQVGIIGTIPLSCLLSLFPKFTSKTHLRSLCHKKLIFALISHNDTKELSKTQNMQVGIIGTISSCLLSLFHKFTAYFFSSLKK